MCNSRMQSSIPRFKLHYNTYIIIVLRLKNKSREKVIILDRKAIKKRADADSPDSIQQGKKKGGNRGEPANARIYNTA